MKEEQLYVYLIESRSYPGWRYVGLTSNVNRRLAEHNEGKSPYTSKYRPWKLVVSIEFHDEDVARKFEKYLKTGSGRTFANRHFR